jgi:biopolymer transport protein ExbD
VQLPLIAIEGIHEIQNHSSIWVFYEIKNQDTIAVLNKNNKLLNTHWIFNIDRRLPMKKVIPILEDLQENRNKDSMHKKEGMLNYFSYADMVSNKMSVFNFMQTFYIKNQREYETHLERILNSKIIEIEIENNVLTMDKKSIAKEELKKYIKNVSANDSLNPIISLKYSENISYQNYLSFKAYLTEEGFNIDRTEYIYTVK